MLYMHLTKWAQLRDLLYSLVRRTVMGELVNIDTDTHHTDARRAGMRYHQNLNRMAASGLIPG